MQTKINRIKTPGIVYALPISPPALKLLKSILNTDPNKADFKVTALCQFDEELFAANRKSSSPNLALEKFTRRTVFGASSLRYRQIRKPEFRKHD